LLGGVLFWHSALYYPRLIEDLQESEVHGFMSDKENLDVQSSGSRCSGQTPRAGGCWLISGATFSRVALSLTDLSNSVNTDDLQVGFVYEVCGSVHGSASVWAACQNRRLEEYVRCQYK